MIRLNDDFFLGQSLDQLIGLVECQTVWESFFVESQMQEMKDLDISWNGSTTSIYPKIFFGPAYGWIIHD